MPLIYTNTTSAISTLDGLKSKTLYCLTVSDKDTTNSPDNVGSLLKLCSDEVGRGFLGAVAVTGNMTLDKIRTDHATTPITASVLTEIINSKDISERHTIGAQGFSGDRGERSPRGETGYQGNTGIQGRRGLPGIQGMTGWKGTVGRSGGDGPQGAIGTQGATGNVGRRGLTGSQGTTGEMGTYGINGPTGAQGPTGEKGARGIQGLVGTQGLTGPNSNYDIPSWDTICQALSTLKIGVSGVFSCQSINASGSVSCKGFFDRR